MKKYSIEKKIKIFRYSSQFCNFNDRLQLSKINVENWYEKNCVVHFQYIYRGLSDVVKFNFLKLDEIFAIGYNNETWWKKKKDNSFYWSFIRNAINFPILMRYGDQWGHERRASGFC